MEHKLEMGAAPRVTLEMINQNIVREDYFTAADGIRGKASGDFPYAGHELMTICVLTLKNGFTVQGISACASPDNFNADTGKHFAREDAVEKIWPLMGYELRSQLAMIEQASPAESGLYHAAPFTGEVTHLDFTTYTGTRVVHATPMTRGNYNKLRGWVCPENEDPADEGYLVRSDSRVCENVQGMKGYVTWLPKHTFEREYQTGVVLKATTFVERLEKEYAELHERLSKLSSFVGTAQFEALPKEDKGDLLMQLEAMALYEKALRSRLSRHQAQ